MTLLPLCVLPKRVRFPCLMLRFLIFLSKQLFVFDHPNTLLFIRYRYLPLLNVQQSGIWRVSFSDFREQT